MNLNFADIVLKSVVLKSLILKILVLKNLMLNLSEEVFIMLIEQMMIIHRGELKRLWH